MRVSMAGLTALPRTHFGQSSAVKERVRLTVLGCGTIASTTRNPVAYMLESENSLDLFDCNSRALPTFHQLGFDLTRLNRIFVGHDHTDHSHGLVEWLEAIGTQAAMRGVSHSLKEIIGPTGLKSELEKDIFRHLVGYENYFEKKFPQLTLLECEGHYFSGPTGNGNLIIYPTRHDDALKSIGFRLVSQGVTIAYPCDFGALQDVNSIAPYLDQADLLILDSGGRAPKEATHLHISEAIEIAKQFKPGLLLASHIPDVTISNPLEPVPENERVRNAQRLIKESGCNNIAIAQTGMYIDF